MRWLRPPGKTAALWGVADSAVLAVSCLLTYWLTTSILARIYAVSAADDALGGMWAVVATIFVFRDSYAQSVSTAFSRISATLASFVLCLLYLLVLPFHVWGFVLLIGLSALVVELVGRPGDAITAAITTAVIMVVAKLSPHDDWREPILRLADTVIGVAVGVAAAWLMLRVIRPRLRGRRGWR
jgi:uncharacterized membrane protein YccC